MRDIIYTDNDGHQRRSYIKEDDPDNMAECGVPAGPPDVRDIDMEAFLKEVNHMLVKAGLFDWDDVQRSNVGLMPAVNFFKRTLVNLYRQASKK